jgi:hypothetical protein
MRNRYNDMSLGYAAFILLSTFLVVCLGLYGWVSNIVSLFHATGFSGAVVLRIIGVFMVPLGIVLGYV